MLKQLLNSAIDGFAEGNTDPEGIWEGNEEG